MSVEVQWVDERPPEYDGNTVEADVARWPMDGACHDLGDDGVQDDADYGPADPPSPGDEDAA